MSAKRINIEGEQPDYPVGANIKKAQMLIGLYLAEFYKLPYSPITKINLWCRGSSGAIMAALFAASCKYECKICHIKKEGEDSHSFGYPRFELGTIVNIIIDDFVATGETILAIIEGITKYENTRCTSVPLDILMVMSYKSGLKDPTLNKFKYIIGYP